MNASLSRFLLLLSAAKDTQVSLAIQAMQNAMVPNDSRKLKFSHFFGQLYSLAQPNNLHFIRAAILDFFFQYKLANAYPNDLSPYQLQRSAHVMDGYVTPIMDAFNQDVDAYIRCELDPKKHPGNACPKDANQEKKEEKELSANFGETQVVTISGDKATVNGTTKNYFDITPPPQLSDLLNGLTSSSPGSGGSGTLGSALANILAPKEVEIVQAITNVVGQSKVYAQVAKNASLTITPTSLDTASSAELNLDFDVKDDSDPSAVNQSKSQADMLDRVSEHHVTTTVRVDSLKLFQVSAFTMQLTHAMPPECWAFSPFCVAWKAVFGGVPKVGDIFYTAQKSQTKDNRSLAVVRAVIVPTAMDLGLSQPYENDRIEDPVTGAPFRAGSLTELLGNVRAYHKKLMSCFVQETSCLGKYKKHKLSDESEDAP